MNSYAHTAAYPCRLTMLFLVLASVRCLLAETVAFGPKSYVVAAGAPQIFTEQLSVDMSTNCPGSPSFMLVVRNGDDSGRNAISSGRIAIDGRTVVDDNDLRPGRPLIELPVALSATSALTLDLKGGQPGSGVTVLIRRMIDVPVTPETTYTLEQKQRTFSGEFEHDGSAGRFVAVIRAGSQLTGSIALNGQEIVGSSDLSTSSGLIRRAVTLATRNSIAVDLAGKPGESLSLAFAREVEESECGPRVRIEQPAANTLIDSARVVVTGTLVGPRQTGVAVNGEPGQIDLDHQGTEADPFAWFAELEPEPGTVMLEAVATDPVGATGRDRREIVFAPSPDHMPLDANRLGGIVPLTIAYHLSLRLTAGAVLVEMDLDGDGVFESIVEDLPDAIQFTYETPGLYRPRIRCTMPDGRVLTATTSVFVQSMETMNAFFQQAWGRFTDALSRGDLAAAAAELAPDQRPKYEAALQAIQADVPTYLASIVRFGPLEIGENSAHYLLVRLRDSKRYAYHVYFLRGSDGVWRLHQF